MRGRSSWKDRVRGPEDADECWRLFQHNTEKKERWTAFRETEHFDQTRLIADESIPDRFVLKANEGEWISIDIGYGGIAGVKELVLYRYTDTFATKKDTRKWILDAKQLDDCFDHRWISDIDTALLKTPRKTK